MSQITENTMVIPTALCNFVEQDLSNYGCDYKKVFQNKQIAIYNFDCNGDSPGDILDSDECKTPYGEIMALETDYLDGDVPWTRFPKEDEETDVTIKEWIKDIVTEEEYKVIAEKIAYSSISDDEEDNDPRNWDYSIMDPDGNIICEDFDYETEEDAENAAMQYIADNGITNYSLDVSQPDW